MNQEDYKEIAKIIKEHLKVFCDTNESIAQLCTLTSDLADYFEKENKCMFHTTEKDDCNVCDGKGSIFDRVEFLKACGVKE